MIDETRKQETDKLRLRIRGVSHVKVAKAMGCSRANTFIHWQRLKKPDEYLQEGTIKRINRALDILGIPKTKEGE